MGWVLVGVVAGWMLHIHLPEGPTANYKVCTGPIVYPPVQESTCSVCGGLPMGAMPAAMPIDVEPWVAKPPFWLQVTNCKLPKDIKALRLMMPLFAILTPPANSNVGVGPIRRLSPNRDFRISLCGCRFFRRGMAA